MAAVISRRILAMSAAVEKPVAQAIQQVLQRSKDASQLAGRTAPVSEAAAHHSPGNLVQLPVG